MAACRISFVLANLFFFFFQGSLCVVCNSVCTKHTGTCMKHAWMDAHARPVLRSFVASGDDNLVCRVASLEEDGGFARRLGKGALSGPL